MIARMRQLVVLFQDVHNIIIYQLICMCTTHPQLRTVLVQSGHMNIRGPSCFTHFFICRMKVVRIGTLFADWSCAS